MKHMKQTPKTTEDDTFEQGDQIPQCHSEASYSMFRRRFRKRKSHSTILLQYTVVVRGTHR